MTTRTPARKSTVQKTAGPAKLPRQSAEVPAVVAVAAAGSIDEQSGAAALKRVRSQLSALLPAEVTPPALNLRAAALAALGVNGLIDAHGLRERLVALGKLGELDLELLQALPDLARATFYVRLKVEQAAALLSEAMVPAALASRGQELRRRMLKLLDFHFEEDPQVFPRLDFIRRGSGYQDLAEDLLGLAELYRAHRTTLKTTPDHYKASDERDAARTAAEIIAWLGGDAAGGAANPELSTYTDLSSRAGLLLIRAYDEVAAAARYLCRSDPALAARFPSLYTLSRARPASPASAPTPEPAGRDAGAAPAQPGDGP